MGYSAGTLDLSILGVSDSAVASIDKTVKSLNSLSRAINKINNTQFVPAWERLELLFVKIAKATNSINTTNIENLASTAKSLSALTKVSKLESMNWDTVASGFNKLSIAITPFLEKVKEAEASLTALYGVLSKSSGKKIGSLLDGGNGSPKSSKNMFGGLFRLGSLTAVLYTAKRLGKEVANIVQSGSDYTETLNLWQVAMRNNLDMAEEFVNKMNKAYGISSKTVMNAQATFKNMIGSLGQIDDATAYKLSEALVQMSADFSSLYNVQLESAFTKMQAMLAGQVRPIRSAGLDMTETTLYQYYQALGGTKSMRQLNRTEKQLLSILAVYKQMGSAGALGDMTKTLNLFANQSRMMTQYWAELKSWSGLILKDYLDQNQVLIYINAALITATEIIKSIAKSKGLGEENFIDGLFETTEQTNEEIDELQGKLLDFDKFRSLSGQEENALGIDKALLEALAGYESKITEAQNAAQDLADTWLKFWLTDEGTLTKDASDFLQTIKDLTIAIGILISLNLMTKAFKFIKTLFTLANAVKIVETALLGGAIYAILKAIECFKEGDWFGGVLATTIGVVLAGAFIYLHKVGITSVINSIAQLIAQGLAFNVYAFGLVGGIAAVTAGLLAMAAAVGLAFYVFSNWETMNGIQKVISVIGVLTVALLGAAIAFGAFHSAWSLGLAIAGIVAGIAAVVAAVNSAKGDIEKMEIPKYAKGASDIDSGTLFVAGKMGKTEAVYTGSNGKTNVANVKQMEQAFYNALARHTSEGNDAITIQAYLDGEKVYENTTSRAKSRGKVWANV